MDVSRGAGGVKDRKVVGSAGTVKLPIEVQQAPQRAGGISIEDLDDRTERACDRVHTTKQQLEPLTRNQRLPRIQTWSRPRPSAGIPAGK